LCYLKAAMTAPGKIISSGIMRTYLKDDKGGHSNVSPVNPAFAEGPRLRRSHSRSVARQLIFAPASTSYSFPLLLCSAVFLNQLVPVQTDRQHVWRQYLNITIPAQDVERLRPLQAQLFFNLTDSMTQLHRNQYAG